MQRRFLLPILGIALLAGCHGNNHQGKADKPLGYDKPAGQVNDRAADDLLAEATKAESEGKYQRAMEVYQYLGSFPEASRPKDLEQRKERLSAKMKSAAK